MDNIFGEKTPNVGKAYRSKSGKGYYLQRENDVLHVGFMYINQLKVNALTIDKHSKIVEIPIEKFNEKMAEVIFYLDIEKYLQVSV